jgi:hypothetical protein
VQKLFDLTGLSMLGFKIARKCLYQPPTPSELENKNWANL